MELKVTLIQTDIVWEDIEENLLRYGQKIDGISETTDLILLPEMFNTGFSMNAVKLAEAESGKTINWMRQKASQKNAVVCGSLIVKENNNYFNRLIWMRPDGSYQKYDKRHLFNLAKEGDVFTAGKEKLLVELKGWKICPQICYDLRFPVWNRNDNGYDVLVNIANWPDKRNFAWKTLLRARAIENQAYVIGLNRVGTDGNGYYYSGDSAVIDPMGETLFEKSDEEAIQTVTLSKEYLQEVRTNLPFLEDKDSFTIEK